MGAGPDRTVAVELIAKIGGYTANTDAAAASTNALAESFTRAGAAQAKMQAGQRAATISANAAAKAQLAQAAAAKKNVDSLATLGRGFLTLGVVAGVGIGAAVKASTDFNKQMALVQTLAKASPAEMKALSTAALTVGQAYGYTATQVAQAQAELKKAGLSVSQILGGALVGSLTLAAAAQTDVGTATEIAVSAMTQFQLHASDIPHLADLLAAGADKALGSAVDLGQGLTQVGTTAHEFGFNVDETVGVLAEFANAGQIGSRAGTELNQAFLQLAAPTKQAQEAMDKYGLSLYDTNGNVKSLSALAGNLQDSFSKLAPEQRNAALATIFGSRAIRAANILYADGAQGVTDWTNKVNDSGFAAGQASGKLDSLAGDVQKFKASLQTGLIETGNEAAGVLRDLVQGLTDLSGWYNNLDDTQKSLVVQAGLVVTGFGLIAGTALLAVPKLAQFKAALVTLGIVAKDTSKALEEEAAASAASGAGASAGAARTEAGAASRASGLLAGSAAFGLPGILIGGAATVGYLGYQAYRESQKEPQMARDAEQQRVNDLAADPAKLAAQRKQAAALQLRLTQAATQRAEVNNIVPGARSVLGSPTNALVSSQDSKVSQLKTQLAGLTKENDAATAAAAKLKYGDDALTSSVIQLGNEYKAVTFDTSAFGTQLSALIDGMFSMSDATDHAVSDGKDLADQVKSQAKQYKDSGTALKGNSREALANRASLEGLTKDYAGIVLEYSKHNHTAAEVQTKTDNVTAAFKKAARQAGFSKGDIQAYIDKLHKIPELIQSNLTLTGVDPVKAQLQQFQTWLKHQDFSVQVTVNANTAKRGDLAGRDPNAPGGDTGPGGATGGQLLDGAFHYSDGGRVFGGPPGRDTVRANLDNGEVVIRKSVAQLPGMTPALLALNRVGMAGGGVAGKAAAIAGYAGGGSVTADTSAIWSLLSNTPTVHDARTSLKSATATLSSAEDHLAKLRKSGTASAKELSAAEDRVSVDRSKRNTARASLAEANKTVTQRFIAATNTAVKVDGAFMSNLQKLAARGYGTLAANLLSQNDDDAHRIAAQAVKMSNGTLAKLNGKLGQSAAQVTKEGLLPAELAISSALKTGKNPTLASIAAATGIDTADLQAGLQDMRSSLGGNKNAAALLSGLNTTGTYQAGTWGATTGQAGPQFHIAVTAPASGNPYSAGEKVALGIKRVYSVNRAGKW